MSPSPSENPTEAAHIAIVTAHFNNFVTEKLHRGAVARLQQAGIPSTHITSLWVPGAVEIPLIVKRLARTQKYEAIIALGAVIKGDTDHFKYVSKQVSDGCYSIALEYDIPVIFGVLTTQNKAQARSRAGGKDGHKGREAAEAALAMLSLKVH